LECPLKDLSLLPPLVPEQEFLSWYVPTVYGPRKAEKENRPFFVWGPGEQESYQRLCSQVLRCNVARTLTGESLRDFGCRLAEMGLLQWFCKLERLDAAVRIPGQKRFAAL
jgi:hypothetical protein